MHSMRLHNEPFAKIKNGTKTVELRLYDEKRRLLNVGDSIEFTNRVTNEKIVKKITNLVLYPNFNELYKHYTGIEMGYNDDDNINPNDMNQYYSLEEQAKYGVIAIEISDCLE